MIPGFHLQSLAALSIVLLLTVSPRPGAAAGNGQPAASGSAALDAQSGFGAPRSRIDWEPTWRRAGVVDFAVMGTAAALAVTFEFLLPASVEPRWTGPILFDESVRSALVLDSPRARSRAASWSDGLLVATIVQPTIVDGLLVPLVGYRSSDAAWQLSAMNLQAYSLTLAAASVTKHLARRERPYASRCPEEASQYACEDADRVHSFFSGHSSIAATGAGLSCAHHAMLGLYGNPVFDAAGCAAVASAALATGALRVASDYHWASDVAVGYLVGFSSGFLMPILLHYRQYEAASTEASGSEAPAVVVGLPQWGEGRVGFAAAGVF